MKWQEYPSQAFRRRLIIILTFLAALTLYACSESQSPSPSPSAATTTPAALATQTPIATQPAEQATPSPTAHVVPTAAEAPTIQPAEPTPAPCPEDIETVTAPSSPVGSLDIAYLSEGNIWLWSEASETTMPLAILDRVSNVRLSGDAQWIAFVRRVGDGEELWVIDRDGTRESRLMDVDAFRQLAVEPLAAAIVTEQLDWAPGAHLVAFNTRPVLPDLPERRYDDLRLINTDDGHHPLWLPAGAGGSFSFSPDGRQISLWQPGQLSLASLDSQTTHDRVISYTADIDLTLPPQPAWAADSQSLRIALPGEMGLFSVWEVPLDEELPVVLNEMVGLPGSVAISPNLAWLAYLRPGPDEFETRELHIAALDGSWDIVYDSGPGLAFLGWAPGGLRFIYQTSQEASIGELCAPATSLQPAPAYGLELPVLVWADDGRFVYAVGKPGTWQLRLGALDGTSDLLAEINADLPIFDLSSHR